VAQLSIIEWTECTWNPIAGCSMCSLGCRHCYALPMAHRLAAMGQSKYQGTTAKVNGRLQWTGTIRIDEEVLDQPRRWRRPRTIFVNSMSDLFHDAVPFEFIARLFAVMESCPQHTFQVLTKRSQRLLETEAHLPWPASIWMGVSVENPENTFRIDQLRATGAKVKFLSLEPLLGPLPELDLHGIDWVIVGGESGPGARPMDLAWVRQIRDRCVARGVRFFFKQWGGIDKKKAGRVLDGRTWDEMPESAAAASR